MRNAASVSIAPYLGGAGGVGNYVDITDRLVGNRVQIRVSIDKSDYESGVPTIPAVALEVWNGDGYFDDGGSDHETPLFAQGGRGGSRVRIQWQGNTIFTGVLYETAAKLDVISGKLSLVALSDLDSSRRASVAVSRIPDNSTPETAIATLVNDIPEIQSAGEIVVPPRLRNNPVIGNGGYFSGRSVWEVLRTLGEAFSVLIYIDDDGRLAAIPSYETTDEDALQIFDPLTAKIESGIKRIVNQVEVSYAAGGETERLVRGNVQSIQRFGESKRTINGENWITEMRAADAIALNIAERNALPARLLSCSFAGAAANMIISQARLFRLVEVFVRESYTIRPSFPDVPLDNNPPIMRRRGLSFRGRILRYNIDVFGGKIDLVVEELQ